jgi:hypothetical protein
MGRTNPTGVWLKLLPEEARPLSGILPAGCSLANEPGNAAAKPRSGSRRGGREGGHWPSPQYHIPSRAFLPLVGYFSSTLDSR